MATEVDPKALQCNRCWQSMFKGGATAIIKTNCNHLYCYACAKKHFGSPKNARTCPLCDVPVAGESELAVLDCGDAGALACAAYALALTAPDDALRILYEATVVARQQTALYGTREIWVRGVDIDNVKRKLVEAENQLNRLGLEVASKAEEVAALQRSVEMRSSEIGDWKRKFDNLSALHAKCGAGGGGRQGGGGGGFNPTPARRGSLQGGGGDGVYFPAQPQLQQRPPSAGSGLPFGSYGQQQPHHSVHATPVGPGGASRTGGGGGAAYGFGGLHGVSGAPSTPLQVVGSSGSGGGGAGGGGDIITKIGGARSAFDLSGTSMQTVPRGAAGGPGSRYGVQSTPTVPGTGRAGSAGGGAAAPSLHNMRAQPRLNTGQVLAGAGMDGSGAAHMTSGGQRLKVFTSEQTPSRGSSAGGQLPRPHAGHGY